MAIIESVESMCEPLPPGKKPTTVEETIRDLNAFSKREADPIIWKLAEWRARSKRANHFFGQEITEANASEDILIPGKVATL